MTRILILYEKVGMGHYRAANILEDILKDKDIEIVKYAGSELLKTNEIKSAVFLWNSLVRRNMIRTVDFVVNYLVRLISTPYGDAFSSTKMLSELEKIDPDIIICTSDMYGKVLGTYASRKGIPYYIFITDITIYFDLVNPYAEHVCYFKETIDTIRSFDFSEVYYSDVIDEKTSVFKRISYVLKFIAMHCIRDGKFPLYRDIIPEHERVNDSKGIAVGALADRKHFKRMDTKKLKVKYGIKNFDDTVLIASGSFGGKYVADTIDMLQKKYKRPVNLIAICGNDKKTYDMLSNIKRESSSVNIIPFEYTESIEELMEISDCIVARPSAGIFMESIIHKKPLLTTGRAASNDRGTISIIEKYKIGIAYKNTNELIAGMEEVLSNKKAYKERMDLFLKNYPDSYDQKAAIIREYLLKDVSRKAM